MNRVASWPAAMARGIAFGRTLGGPGEPRSATARTNSGARPISIKPFGAASSAAKGVGAGAGVIGAGAQAICTGAEVVGAGEEAVCTGEGVVWGGEGIGCAGAKSRCTKEVSDMISFMVAGMGLRGFRQWLRKHQPSNETCLRSGRMRVGGHWASPALLQQSGSPSAV